MPSRTHAEKLELKDHFRRAAHDWNKQGPFRKGAFRRMLDIAKEADLDSLCKNFITERVKDFFGDFPEWQDEAINMVYDMCEDQDQQVRIEGYRALSNISKADKTWLVRNADVLVQLLQSDDPSEVTVIERSLQEHIDIDAPRTLQVLCDQCVFNPAELADDEDRALRSRLRGLVLKFLAEKYRVCIVRAVRNHEVERILMTGLVEAIPLLSPHELRLIVTDILLNLPTLSNGPTQNGNIILDALINTMRRTLQTGRPDVDKLSSLLEEVVQVITPESPDARLILTKRSAPHAQSIRPSPAADGLRVLKFVGDDELMQRLPSEVGPKIVECACAAYVSVWNCGNKTEVRAQMVDAAPALLRALTRCVSTKGHDVCRSCLGLLCILQELFVNHKQDCTSSLAAALKAFVAELSSTLSDSKSNVEHGIPTEPRVHPPSDETKQAMELSRNLLKTAERLSPSKDVPINRTQERDGQPNSTKATETSHLTHRALPPTPSNARSESGISQELEGAYGDASPQACKKLKSTEGTSVEFQTGVATRSLLSRLGPASIVSASSASGGSVSPRPNVSGSPSETSATLPVSGSDGAVRSHIIGLAGTQEDSSHITITTRTQNTPASVAVGTGAPSKPNTSRLSTNGEMEKSALDSQRQKESRQSSVTEPMAFNILGASTRAEGFKIRGAAERRKSEDNEVGSPGGGGLSLLTRLSYGGGGARIDHTRSRKRKRINKS